MTTLATLCSIGELGAMPTAALATRLRAAPARAPSPAAQRFGGAPTSAPSSSSASHAIAIVSRPSAAVLASSPAIRPTGSEDAGASKRQASLDKMFGGGPSSSAPSSPPASSPDTGASSAFVPFSPTEDLERSSVGVSLEAPDFVWYVASGVAVVAIGVLAWKRSRRR